MSKLNLSEIKTKAVCPNNFLVFFFLETTKWQAAHTSPTAYLILIFFSFFVCGKFFHLNTIKKKPVDNRFPGFIKVSDTSKIRLSSYFMFYIISAVVSHSHLFHIVITWICIWKKFESWRENKYLYFHHFWTPLYRNSLHCIRWSQKTSQHDCLYSKTRKNPVEKL